MHLLSPVQVFKELMKSNVSHISCVFAIRRSVHKIDQIAFLKWIISRLETRPPKKAFQKRHPFQRLEAMSHGNIYSWKNRARTRVGCALFVPFQLFVHHYKVFLISLQQLAAVASGGTTNQLCPKVLLTSSPTTLTQWSPPIPCFYNPCDCVYGIYRTFLPDWISAF